MVTIDFHRWLGVRVVGRLEPDLFDTDLLVELRDDSDEVRQAEVTVDHEALDLVEFGEVGQVQGLVAEHPIDREELPRSEIL
jgi:hypothetical protein